ncbi:MAG: hypothetical protein DRQ97_07015 [Gammaproteobacteria bacterium]|nr:MAG: hypothetical protein DRQ97_07015 [Gammaproteobacteria bacterium]
MPVIVAHWGGMQPWRIGKRLRDINKIGVTGVFKKLLPPVETTGGNSMFLTKSSPGEPAGVEFLQ